ncbi:MAG: hypothetical protein V3S31_00915, partial [Dehalococcoidia bacterium]
TATTEATEAATTEVEAAAGLVGGLPEFTRTTVGWNGYWYSRYNLGELAMMSGLGITFSPPAEAMMQMMATADPNPGSGEDIPMLKNPALLAAVFASADPHFAQPNNGDPLDLSNGRLDPSTFDTTITPGAQGMTILKEAEWAKLFLLPAWSGTLDGDFGAFDRFKGLVLFASAKMQAQFALEHLRNADGLFVAASAEGGAVTQSQEAARAYDQYVMIIALSDVLAVLDEPERWQGVYRDDSTRDMLHGALDGLYALISDTVVPQTIEDLAWAARSDVWFASRTGDAVLKLRALSNLRERGDALLALQADGPLEHARRLRGLVEAGRVLDDARYIDAAASDFTAIERAFDRTTGALDGVSTLRAAGVADLLGALNAIGQYGRPEVDAARVAAVLVPFYEATINIGGLQMAAPPKEMEASPFELDRTGGDDLVFAYPTVKTPAAAGGVAPVTGGAVSFADGRWQLSDQRYDTHDAMYLANEEFWLFGMVAAFPQVDRTTAALHTGFPEATIPQVAATSGN